MPLASVSKAGIVYTSSATIMKTKSLLATIGVCLTILTSTLVLIAVVVVQDNRELRRELRTLRADLHQASTEAGQLRAETADATTQLAAKHDELEELEQSVAKSKTAISRESEEVAASTAPRASRVRAYLGSQYLGMAWMVPSPLPKEAESGRVLYEPVLVLDESLKSTFAANRTDVAGSITRDHGQLQLPLSVLLPRHHWQRWQPPARLQYQPVTCAAKTAAAVAARYFQPRELKAVSARQTFFAKRKVVSARGQSGADRTGSGTGEPRTRCG